jgi:hypothetical protein
MVKFLFLIAKASNNCIDEIRSLRGRLFQLNPRPISRITMCNLYNYWSFQVITTVIN